MVGLGGADRQVLAAPVVVAGGHVAVIDALPAQVAKLLGPDPQLALDAQHVLRRAEQGLLVGVEVRPLAVVGDDPVAELVDVSFCFCLIWGFLT
jgi:hypothetical protein